MNHIRASEISPTLSLSLFHFITSSLFFFSTTISSTILVFLLHTQIGIYTHTQSLQILDYGKRKIQ